MPGVFKNLHRTCISWILKVYKERWPTGDIRFDGTERQDWKVAKVIIIENATAVGDRARSSS